MDNKKTIIVNHSDIEKAMGKKPLRAFLKDHTAAAPALADPAVSKKLEAMEHALESLRQCERHPDVLTSPENTLGALLQAFFAKKLAKKLEEKPLLEGTHIITHGGLKVPFDDDDVLRWILDAVTSLFIAQQDFIPAPKDADSLDNQDMNVAILGDWGSALYGAVPCARSVEKTQHDLAIHIGDVYYIGDEESVVPRFLNVWPNGQKLSRALMGNHEAYAGGDGFYNHICTDSRFNQKSSVFWLQNDSYMILGIDTGFPHGPVGDLIWEKSGWSWKDHGLENEQIDWLKARLAGAGSRKVILFSHHQPFTLYEQAPSKLKNDLDSLLQQKKVVAWYWGHEHRAVFYDYYDRWGLYGRCLGHSGFPAFRDHFTDEQTPQPLAVDGYAFRTVAATNEAPVGGRVLDGPNDYLDKDYPQQYGPQGYLEITLGSAGIEERLFTPEGKLLYKELLKV